MPTIFALTVVAIVTWFVVVFRRLTFLRRLLDPGYFAMLGAATVRAMDEMNATLVATTAAMEQLGATVRETLTSMEAALSPKQREIYDELRGIGVYPLDAVNEACARWPD